MPMTQGAINTYDGPVRLRSRALAEPETAESLTARSLQSGPRSLALFTNIPMSRVAKGNAFAHINDTTLGAFAYVPPSEVLNHLIRFLSTWSGTELRTAFLCS